MGERLTPQQQQAVSDRGGKVLVSAAAGSGKTKVLVDRILSYLKDPIQPANIDDFLIITYTKAAAAELRGKIASKLSQEISADPGNRHLQKQLQRLYLTKISTVHAYCTDLLREHAYRLDIPVDFRIAEENECQEMQHIVIEKLLNDVYENLQNDAEFCAFVDSQGFGRNDRKLAEIILKLYNSARCHKDPDGWLDWCLKICTPTNVTDISQTPWAQYLIDDLHYYLDLYIDALTKCTEAATNAEGMEKPVALLQDTIYQLSKLRACDSWDMIARNAKIDFGKLTFPRKNLDVDMAASIKAVRESCKKDMQKKLRRFSDSTEQVLSDMYATAVSARGLITVTRMFIEEYDKIKKRRRVLDFGDLEHKALDLLTGKQRYGATAIAMEVGQRYREVMVDEYQDTNEVQDAIFEAITEKRQNCFMVGDVKQSIYQFRLADPKIFLQKYDTYLPAESASCGFGRKVLLSSNFRSGKGVIDAVNDVFTTCLSKRVGGLYYGSDEMLYEGVPHMPLDEPEVELYGILAQDGAYVDEAEFVAQRVRELIDGTHMVRDGDIQRPIRPDDIAILLRSPGSVGGYYMDALEHIGVPCQTGNTDDLLGTEEVQTLRAILQIIDNPQQDIPVLAALTSKVFGFSSDDLAGIRSAHKSGSIYDALKNDASVKAKCFVDQICALRKKARSNTLLGLLKHIITITKIDSIFASMQDGETRVENLLEFYKIAADFDAGGGKSLNRFLLHLDALDEKGLAVACEQSNTGAVTIMSIHKSKGLEFPVVILPALSRGFNKESAYENMLCDKELGLGLSCVDIKNRVRYPSVAKHAIATKVLADNLSEEMRVLYVAMTRARDRLIMTYAAKNLESELMDLSLRMEYTAPELLTSEANCPGQWVLLAALQRMEAQEFFKLTPRTGNLKMNDNPWKIRVIENIAKQPGTVEETQSVTGVLDTKTVDKMKQALSFVYPFGPATQTPSKQTATQIKGRDKDMEVADSTVQQITYAKNFRKPSFVGSEDSGVQRGNAVHIAMQYIRYEFCGTLKGVENELLRLVQEGLLTQKQVEVVDAGKIARFFNTETGKNILAAKSVLREFKFSILEDASYFDSNVTGEEILLQGVVDCALLEEDGITVIDFKTDSVTNSTVTEAAQRYKPQIFAYANSLARIYGRPIKSVMLYFFEPEMFVSM